MTRVSGLILLTLAVLAAFICAAGCIGTPADEENATLLVYAGAGLKAPMAEIGTVFGEQNGVTVRTDLRGIRCSYLSDGNFPPRRCVHSRRTA